MSKRLLFTLLAVGAVALALVCCSSGSSTPATGTVTVSGASS